MNGIKPNDPIWEMPADIRQAYLAAMRAGPLEKPLTPLSSHELEAPIELSEEDDAPRSQASLSIQGYHISSEISSGGQATVYRAIQESTGMTVAVKVMAGGGLVGTRRRIRFEREAQILAKLDHPNIVSILDRGRTADGSFFIVMKYIRGPTLDGYLRGDEKDRDLTLSIFESICEAVEEAHAKGVVHRDLKPSNIRVDDRGDPHVLDFGLATALAEPDEPALLSRHEVTMTGQILGSLPWASPEVVAGQSKHVTAASDVYSLGVMLYECIAGVPPYEITGPTLDVVRSICREVPVAPSLARRGARGWRWLPETRRDPLDCLILKCLAKDPKRRYASAGELGRALSACRTGAARAPFNIRASLAAASAIAALVVIVTGLIHTGKFSFTPRPPSLSALAGQPSTATVPLRPMIRTSFGMELIRIEPGTFMMGSTKNEPDRGIDELQRRVVLTRPFYLGATLVTQAQYQTVVGTNPSDPLGQRLDFPVQRISFHDAEAFCNLLSQREHRHFRLPTEAEWEYACRAETQTPYAGNLPDMGWYDSNSDGHLHPVGQLRPNAWGLYDMHGLLNEWCSDFYARYRPDDVTDPKGIIAYEGHHHVIRGGDFTRTMEYARSAARGAFDPDLRVVTVGFRVACDVDLH